MAGGMPAVLARSLSSGCLVDLGRARSTAEPSGHDTYRCSSRRVLSPQREDELFGVEKETISSRQPSSSAEGVRREAQPAKLHENAERACPQ
jgi:hypothetical protein